jgi:polar amino acid transport system substrate-binding protein
MRPPIKLALGALLLVCLPLRAGQIVVAVDSGTEMPMARFEGERMVGGVHHDIGAAIARQLGRTPVFLTLPRMRIGAALLSGEADLLCAYIPAWIDGPLGWSTPFLPVTELLISDVSVNAPHTLADLAGQKVGTILGYRHPEFDAALGARFRRIDAPNADTNLRLLAAGRITHAIIVKSALDYRLKLGEPKLHLHTPLVVKQYMTQCAVSPKGHVKLEEVDRAIAQMVKAGEVAAILGRYQ